MVVLLVGPVLRKFQDDIYMMNFMLLDMLRGGGFAESCFGLHNQIKVQLAVLHEFGHGPSRRFDAPQ
jgi:hypothetical protein